MKHRHLLCASFFLAASLHAGEADRHPSDVFLTQSDFKEILQKNDVNELDLSSYARLCVLELKNGSQFPVVIEEGSISLNDGWKMFTVRPEDLIDVSVDGGLYGTVYDSEGKESELDYSLINDRHLRVRVLRSGQTADIAWEEIKAIRKLGTLESEKQESVEKEVEERDHLPEVVVQALFNDQDGETEPEEISWLDETSQEPGSENMQIAMVTEDESLSHVNPIASQESFQKWQEIISKLETQNTALYGKARDYALLNGELEERQSYLASMIEFEISRSDKVKASVADLSDQLRSALAELHEIKTERKGAEERYEKKSADLVREIASKEEKISELQAFIEDKYREIAQVFNEQKQVHEELLEKISTLEEQNHAATAMRSQLEVELEQALSSKKEEQAETVEEIARMKLHYEEMEEELSVQAALLVSEIAAVNEKNARLEDLLKGREEAIESKNSEIASLAERLENESEQLAQMKQNYAEEFANLGQKALELEKGSSHVRQLLAQAQAELDDKDDQIERLTKVQESYISLHGKTALLEQERETLVSHNSQLKESYALLQDEYHEKLASLGQESEAKNSEIVEIEGLLAKEKKKSEVFKKKLDQLFPQHEIEKKKGLQLQEQLGKMNSKLYDLENTLRVSEARGASVQDKLSRLAQENQQISKEKEMLLHQVQQTQNRLKEQRELASRLNQSFQEQTPSFGYDEKKRQEPAIEPKRDHFQAYELNKDLHPSLIAFKGIHVVASGENLNNISMKYYNTPHRWADIYEANRDAIAEVDRLQVGTPLVIPD